MNSIKAKNVSTRTKGYKDYFSESCLRSLLETVNIVNAI